MRNVARGTFCVALFCGTGVVAEPLQQLPSWMAGSWATQQSDGSWIEESWTSPRAGLMMGAGRSGKGDALEWWEHTRIEQSADGMRFCALPKGQAGACFRATKTGANEVIFENTGHDYPTRISYRLAGKELRAEISGPNGTKPQSWRFKRSD